MIVAYVGVGCVALYLASKRYFCNQTSPDTSVAKITDRNPVGCSTSQIHNKLHKVIESNKLQPNSKAFVIGDVHGCLEELKELVKKLDFNPESDLLIFVGDLVNKGPYSAEVVRYVREMNGLCVTGNHDETMLEKVIDRQNGKTIPDKYSYLDKLST